MLHARYIAKATLNRFRVDNGYKNGEYAKSWKIDGQTEQDNYWLSTWVTEQLENGIQLDQDMIYNWLKKTYPGKV
jgi:hypothetical protein